MSETVGDYLLERLATWGVKRDLRLSRATASTASWARSSAQRTGPIPSSSRSATRRWRRSWPAPTPSSPARSACAWPPRARRDPPAERALRRQARPPAGGRDRRPAGARRRSAATTSRRSTCRSLFKDVAHEYVQMAMVPGADPPPGRPRLRIALAERTVTCDHHPQRPAGGRRGRDAAARARHRPLGPRLPRAARGARATTTSSGPPRS